MLNPAIPAIAEYEPSILEGDSDWMLGTKSAFDLYLSDMFKETIKAKIKKVVEKDKINTFLASKILIIEEISNSLLGFDCFFLLISTKSSVLNFKPVL